MAINDVDFNSDDEVDVKQHARLLTEVLHLDKKQSLKKPSRTEPTTHVSEFTLVKPKLGRKTNIHVSDLTKTLNKKNKHAAITKKIKSAQQTTKTLRKPLEKPEAERIKRNVGFETNKTELGKWNAIVSKNRVASQLQFPLSQGKVDFENERKKNNKIMFPMRFKSELDKELEKIDPVDAIVEEEDSFPLTMDEMMQRRKEMAKLRALQSYQEAKARRKKKIKSKKFHRVERKEKLKQQMKEFEELRKTNPEEALRKLEELEKTRVEERMSLRHRSTGQWAKNKQVRAKYDKESRQAIAHQLSISRELTQKLKTGSDSESEPELENDLPVNTDRSNPWVTNQSSEIKDFVSGYRKYWNEKNKTNLEQNEISKVLKQTVTNKTNEDAKNNSKDKNQKKIVIENKKQNGHVEKPKKKIEKNKLKKPKVIEYCNSSWTVTSINEKKNKDVEEIFDDLTYSVQHKTEEKLKKMKSLLEKSNRKRKLSDNESEEEENDPAKCDVNFPREKRIRPELDEAIGIINDEDDDISVLKKTIAIEKQSKINDKKLKNGETRKDLNANIDPSKYISIKPVHLDTRLPDTEQGDDNEELDEEIDQTNLISEAFADDDIVDDFNKEKRDIIDKDKPKDIDSFLPGWGNWGGTGVVPVSKKKRKRFITKMPKKEKRRDDNKGNLIINEHKDVKIKKHQVSEMPFPFTSVKDFESSIRAPIGDTFVPQTAFRRFIKPPVVTKKGAIIEPMNENVLLQHKFTKNGMFIKK